MTTSTITHLDESSFDHDVLQSDRPVLVDFWADWCQPCHMLSPTIEALAHEYGDRVTVAKVDIDASRDLALRYGINSIPTVVIFQGGAEAERLVGVRSRGDYAAALDRLLA